jgi:hypothetical protein
MPANPARKLKVFLCHAAEDKQKVRMYHTWLTEAGFDVWMDEENLEAGQDWDYEISVAIRNSDAILIFLSSKSVSKEGYVQKEIARALDIALEKLEGAIFIIPVRLEVCDIPYRLKRFQYVDLFEKYGNPRLKKSLYLRAQKLGVLPTVPDKYLATTPKKKNKALLSWGVGAIWVCVLASCICLASAYYFQNLFPASFFPVISSPTVPMLPPSLTPSSEPVIPTTAVPSPTFTEASTIAPTAFVPTQAVPDPNDLVLNGSFVNGFDGWTRELLDNGGSSKAHIISFGSGRFGSALHIENEGKGGIYFWQIVALPNLNVDFSATFISRTNAGLLGGGSQSDVVIVYLDSQEQELGRTIISNKPGTAFTDTNLYGAPQTPKDTNQEHYFFVKNDTVIKDFRLNLSSEVQENLLGINVGQIAKVQIILATGGSAFYSDLIVTDVSILPSQ